MDLCFGARGPQVKNLQQMLSKRGYLLRTDGLFGLATHRSVQAFQRDNHLPETGTVGAVELKLLRQGSNESPPLQRLGRRLVKSIARLLKLPGTD